MNKIEVTPVLVAMNPIDVESGYLCKGAIFGSIYIVGEEPCINVDIPQQLVIISNGEITDWYLDDTNQIRKAVTLDKDYWASRKSYKRIEAAYPTIEGCYKISPDFMQKFCANPKGKFWMEMKEKCDGIDDFVGGAIYSKEPRIDKDGYIVLEIKDEPKETYPQRFKRQVESDYVEDASDRWIHYVDEQNKPVVVERFADNGEHSHWEVIAPKNGEILWTEFNDKPTIRACAE